MNIKKIFLVLGGLFAICVVLTLVLVFGVKIIPGLIVGGLVKDLAMSAGLDQATGFLAAVCLFFLFVGLFWRFFQLRNWKWVVRFLCLFVAVYCIGKIFFHNLPKINKHFDAKAAIVESNKVYKAELETKAVASRLAVEQQKIEAQKEVELVRATYSQPITLNLAFPPQRDATITTVNVNHNYNVPPPSAKTITITAGAGLGSGRQGPRMAKENCIKQIPFKTYVIISERYYHTTQTISDFVLGKDNCEMVVKSLDNL